jgi:MSHA biogenesis protein MshJ
MTPRLKEWAAKIDELGLRERGLVFIVGAMALVILVYTMALQPLLRQQRGYLDRMRADETQLKAVNDALLKSAQDTRDDPLAAKRQALRELEEKLTDSERRLAERRNAQATPEQLTALLRDILGRSRSVRLVALRVLPATPLAAKPAAGADASGQFYRHAVEVEMAGPYLELLKYLEDVESLPWKLNWSGIDLKTTTYPEVRLRATLYTVSSSPSLIKL